MTVDNYLQPLRKSLFSKKVIDTFLRIAIQGDLYSTKGRDFVDNHTESNEKADFWQDESADNEI